MTDIRCLRWGCGGITPRSRIDSDTEEGASVDVSCGVLDGSPPESNSTDYISSQHALNCPEILDAVDAAPRGLRRVPKPGGVPRPCPTSTKPLPLNAEVPEIVFGAAGLGIPSAATLSPQYRLVTLFVPRLRTGLPRSCRARLSSAMRAGSRIAKRPARVRRSRNRTSGNGKAFVSKRLNGPGPEVRGGN